MLGLLKRVLNQNERELRRLRGVVEQVNALEPEVASLSDGELAGRTAEFRGRLERGASLDDILPEAFAVVREASRRVLGMRHFDVQLMGGVVLHEGKVAEMKTGEGKTLVATLPAYLNALEGHGVHVVTVNDYLARRDSEWMGQIYRFLGLSVGLIVHGLTAAERRRSYQSDITYGTNNEFGFDYLRDNMALYRDELVQRELNYAIVDEVDSILIDEARTPLIISGHAERPTDLYYKFARIVQRLRRDVDYTVDEKAHSVAPTEEGVRKVEEALGVKNLYADDNMDLSRYLVNGLKAKELYHLDRQYVVKDGQVIIVDEFTGRLMWGRRWSDGLHQAVEAKEGVRIQRESQTLATITLQNYFRMYRKLAGMTGTAATEEEEFQKIYKMDVTVVPTHMPMIRTDHPDVVYKTEDAKFRAVVREIKECYERGQPVLVGTVSIEKSERLSAMLKREGIPHQVLNAKYHEKEAEIVAQAGRHRAVTIATNMAGRGTDILLGGNPEFLARQELRRHGYPPEVMAAAVELYTEPASPEVAEARARYLEVLAEKKRETEAEHERVVAVGGLHIIGTERHESRRIDNQLRGRSGRQGDPGSSRFYLSLEDDLMRIFGADMVKGFMDRLGVQDDEPIESGLVTRAVERAQKRVENRNFEIRKHVLEYDDVMNQQRQVIYGQRRRVLEGESLREAVLDMMREQVERAVAAHAPAEADPEEWDLAALVRALEEFAPAGLVRAEDLEGLGPEALRDEILGRLGREYERYEEALGEELMRELERVVVLRTVDERWIEHLEAMDELRDGIGLRAYGQKDPLVEYKHEAFDMFQQMIEAIKAGVAREVLRSASSLAAQRAEREAAVVPLARKRVVADAAAARGPALVLAGGGFGAVAAAGFDEAVGDMGPPGVATAGGAVEANGRREPRRVGPKVGRNDPCPCGSGKKYKRCCGA